tara:strand:+ start:345 stop:710 length:366 start_codon:yes stop_codon:yes gene_type:complete
MERTKTTGETVPEALTASERIKRASLIMKKALRRIQGPLIGDIFDLSWHQGTSYESAMEAIHKHNIHPEDLYNLETGERVNKDGRPLKPEKIRASYESKRNNRALAAAFGLISNPRYRHLN